MRIVHESHLQPYPNSCWFVTLTYRDMYEATDLDLTKRRYIPDDWSLSKDHVVRFNKRLRKKFSPGIKFFLAGEYGNRCMHGIDLQLRSCSICTTGRPHYHGCYLGLHLNDLKKYGETSFGRYYTSESLEKLWGYGFVNVSEFNFQTAGYVTRYTLKKRTGAMADTHYLREDLEGNQTYITPEFCLMSRGGKHGKGLGFGFIEKYGQDFKSGATPVPGRGMVPGIPRYYLDQLEDIDPDLADNILELRRTYMEEHKSEFSPQALRAKYDIARANNALFKKGRTL